MKKKLFLAGILGLALIFALTLIGCPNDGGDGGDNPGNNDGGGNPLLGTWVDDDRLQLLSEAVIFTDSASTSATAAPGTKIAYYSTNLSGGNDISNVGGTDQLMIGNTQYIVELNAGQLVLKDYIPPQGQGGPNPVDAQDVTFKRAPGTSGSGLPGIWIPDGTVVNTAHPQYTIILIGGTSRKRVWSTVGNNDWGVVNYFLSEVGGNTVISWDGGNALSYNKSTIGMNNTTSLVIRLPGKNGDSTLYPLYTNPTF
ncbi:MAG: hypothetical protein LBQ88_01895 [Treponema sp.]|jgi:hypothetical protein|nr:hypothetical protein [Treponema sp.]